MLAEATSSGTDWNLVLGIISLAANVLLGIGMAYIASKQGEIRDLRSKLEETVDRSVEKRFQTVDKEISQIHQRLDDGSQTFGTLADRNSQIQLAVANKMAETREWMLQTFVTKADLKTFVRAVREGKGDGE